jgi:hypothetical protein
MKVISKNGKVFSPRFAKIAIKIGLGKEVEENEEPKVKKVRKQKK